MPARIPDEDYIDAIRKAFEEKDIDSGEGGVHPTTVADRLDISLSRTYTRLQRLANEDRLVVVSGINLETMSPRKSYVCPEHVEPTDYCSNFHKSYK